MKIHPISDEATGLEQVLARSVIACCDALADCSESAGAIYRPFLSSSMERCNELVGSWMANAGMEVRLDQAGNLRGLYEGSHANAPRLLIASHLDTVPDAGKYDGVLGVVIGIALIQSLSGEHLPFAIEVIGFSDEEGVRFGLPFVGSRAIVGKLSVENRLSQDVNGISLAAAMESFQSANPGVIAAQLHPHSRAYLEFHIEQGPVLDDAGEALAVVEAIAGQSRATVLFRGRAGHAGTTPMLLRQDAMTAAAEWVLAVEATALATPGLVASTGRISCEPGATNIIPGLVRSSLDLRSKDDTLREKTLEFLVNTAHAIASRRKVQVSYTLDAEQPTVLLDPSLTLLVESSIGARETRRMVSGAGHDAMMIAPHLPSAMIFLRSPGGISHHPDEAVLIEDVTKAISAGMQFLEKFGQWVEGGEQPTCTT